jgi:hypothetical protein
LTAAILFGAAPIASLACQWACAAGPGHAHADESGASSMHAHDRTEQAPVVVVSANLSSSPSCDHSALLDHAVISAAAKDRALVAVASLPLPHARLTDRSAAITHPDASPPGTPPARVSLRI